MTIILSQFVIFDNSTCRDLQKYLNKGLCPKLSANSKRYAFSCVFAEGYNNKLIIGNYEEIVSNRFGIR